MSILISLKFIISSEEFSKFFVNYILTPVTCIIQYLFLVICVYITIFYHGDICMLLNAETLFLQQVTENSLDHHQQINGYHYRFFPNHLCFQRSDPCFKPLHILYACSIHTFRQNPNKK